MPLQAGGMPRRHYLLLSLSFVFAISAAAMPLLIDAFAFRFIDAMLIDAAIALLPPLPKCRRCPPFADGFRCFFAATCYVAIFADAAMSPARCRRDMLLRTAMMLLLMLSPARMLMPPDGVARLCRAICRCLLPPRLLLMSTRLMLADVFRRAAAFSLPPRDAADAYAMP